MAINRYSTTVDNALSQYVPLPMDTIFKAAQATQQRYDQSVADDTALQTGLASIEARAPGYRDYVNNQISKYRNTMGTLIDEFGGRLDDPEFKRRAKQVQNQYANDPTFQTIKLGNEAIKRSQDLESRLRAEGKLYISDLPNFKGTDANGRLIPYEGAPQAVNVLDEWMKAGQIAHGSTEDIGNVTTNKRNLDRWRNTLKSDTAGQAKLYQAYLQQGMTPQQAQSSVNSAIQGLVNQYGIETKTNTALLGYGLSREQFAYQKQRDKMKDDLALELAKMKANAKKGTASDGSALPTVRQNELGFSTGLNSKNNLFVPTFGGSTLNTPQPIGSGFLPSEGSGFYRQDATAKSYNGVLKKQTGAAKLNNGQLDGYYNVAVDKNGNVITSSKEGKFIERNGKTYYEYTNDEGKTLHKEAKPQTMRVYSDKATGSKYYVPANAQDAMRNMGATGAYWEGKKSIGEKLNFSGNAEAPQQLKNIIGSFDFRNQSTVQTLVEYGSARGYNINDINRVFNKAVSGQKLTRPDALMIDRIITDISDANEYNSFVRPEFNDQGKRTNIYSKITNQKDDNTLSSKDVSEQLQDYLKDNEE